MSRIILNTKIWLFVLLVGMSFPAWAQSDDFNTWTKFKVNHKIDSRFSVSGDLELRMKDDVSRLDRWGLTVGGSYRPCSFLNLGVGYETHLRNLGDSDWKLRHRYHISATAPSVFTPISPKSAESGMAPTPRESMTTTNIRLNLSIFCSLC